MTNEQIKAQLANTLQRVYGAQQKAISEQNWDRRDELADIASGIRVAIDNVGRSLCGF